MTDTLDAPRTKGPIVWMGMDQTELDNAYDQAVYAPNQPLVHARRTPQRRAPRRGSARRSATSMARARSRASTSIAPARIPTTRRSTSMSTAAPGGTAARADFVFLSEMIVDAGAHSVIADFNNIDDVGGNLMTMAKQVRSRRGLGLQQR